MILSRKLRTLMVLLILITTTSFGQTLARFEVELSTAMHGISEPVRVDLDDITFLAENDLSLVEVQGKNRIPVPMQIENKKRRSMYWLVNAADPAVKKRIYELVRNNKPVIQTTMEAKLDNGTLTISSDAKKLLRYHFKTMYPPQGIDTAYRRSGFIHPVWTPHGQELTRIQPPDHYHHYGIWNPWTHVLFEGDTVDFWNIRGKQGTVRFANFASIAKGSVYAEYRALHEHIVFKKDGKEKVALNELQTVRVYRAEQDYFIVDITIEMNCASESPFRILEYRYAGLGWRATAKWNKSNSEVLTSEGKNRKESDGSNARWAIIQGELDNDYGGAVMMSYPANYNHPEPLRIWPEDSNNGEMFAMFAPTKNKDWLLNPNQTYTLNYRFIVFNGRFTKEKADSGWNYYSTPPKIVVK